MIEVYFLDTNCFLKNTVFDRYYKNISQYRKQKIDRLKYNNDKNLSLGASVLIDIFLSKNGYREKDLTYIENIDGKPKFEHLPNFKFSISHSADKVMVCFSDYEVGCDIEKVSNVNLNIAKRFFTGKEYNFLLSVNDFESNEYFYKIWTLKESFLKAIGAGVKKPLNSFEVDYTKNKSVLLFENKDYHLYQIESFSGFKCCVCSEKAQKIKKYYIDLEK